MGRQTNTEGGIENQRDNLEGNKQNCYISKLVLKHSLNPAKQDNVWNSHTQAIP